MGEVINRVALLRLALLPLLLLARVALGQSADLRWPETTSEAKPWTRWWWMGSAVDSENLTAELKTLAGPRRRHGAAARSTGRTGRGRTRAHIRAHRRCSSPPHRR